MDLMRYLNSQAAAAQITAENQLEGETVSPREARHLYDTWALLAGMDDQVMRSLSLEQVARAFMGIDRDTMNERITELAFGTAA